MKSETRGTVWKCSTCDKEFKYESEKRRHEQSHVPQFECKVCSKKFSFVSALRRHEKQHERTKSAHCTTCGGQFRDEILLKRHIQYAHKGTFQCKKCNSIFNSEAALRIHMKTHRPESERSFRCSYDGCGKSFNFAHHLKHHELTHSDEKPHVCTECGKQFCPDFAPGFIQLHHLKIHQRVHKPDSWLSCAVRGCHKEFTNEYALKRHVATHNNKDLNTVPSKLSTNDTIVKKRHLLEIKPLKKRRRFQEETQDITKEIKLLSVSTLQNIKNECPSPVLAIPIESETPKQNSTSIEQEYNDEVDTKDNFEEFDTKGATADENVEIDDIDLSVSNCKSVLGKCMETGDSEPNESCLCTQITSVDKAVDFNELNVQKTNINVQLNIIDDLKCIEKRRNDVNACETCECASICGIRDKPATDSIEIDTPELELRNDTIIKIKDTFDLDFEGIKDKNKNTLENNVKPKVNNMMNSCKDILGNCIVSGNGTIGEGCLCARMTADDQQIIAQEIEDLTICPKNC